MDSISYWDRSALVRQIEIDGQQAVQQMWIKRYLMQINGKEVWVNSEDYIWADPSDNLNDPSYWEKQG